MPKALLLALALLVASAALVPAAQARYTFVEVCAGACLSVDVPDPCMTSPPEPVRQACAAVPCFTSPPDPVAPACQALAQLCAGQAALGVRATACVLATWRLDA